MTEPETLKLIINHFASVANELNSQAMQAGLLTNPTGIGTEREEVYRKFLERHVPKMCDVFLGGYVFDLRGNRSQQIDVILAGGNTPRFQFSAGNKFIAPLEGTIAVAEVKSKLDKNTLKEAFHNCSSIPPMPDPADIIPPIVRLDEESWEDMPLKVIFAFDGIERGSLCKHLEGLLRKNKNQPASRFPNIIHVLGKYTIRKVNASRIIDTSTGTVAKGNKFAYHIFSRNADVMAIMEMLTAIQHRAFASNFLNYNYGEWYGQVLNVLEEE